MTQSNGSLRGFGGNEFGSPGEKSRKQLGVIDLRPGAVLSEQNGLSSSNQNSSYLSLREPTQLQSIPFPTTSVAYDGVKNSTGSGGSGSYGGREEGRYYGGRWEGPNPGSYGRWGEGLPPPPPFVGRGEAQSVYRGWVEGPPASHAGGQGSEVQSLLRPSATEDTRKISDNSSLSSYSSRCSSPNRVPSHRSSIASHSSSSPPHTPPSPSSPTPVQLVPPAAVSAPPPSRLPVMRGGGGGGLIDHISTAGSLIRGSRLTLKRQVCVYVCVYMYM